MADPDATSRSWWSTLPGILTALAAIITALGGLLAVLGQQGLFGNKAPAAVSTTASPPSSGASPATTAPAKSRDADTDRTTASPGDTHRSGPPAASASAVAQSPAQVVAGLKASGFKGIAVTAIDSSVISLRPDADINGQSFPLNNGQSVQFDRIVSIEMEQPWAGHVRITLTNGQQLDATTGNYSLRGSNELGAYHASMPDIRRIDFIR